MNSLKAYLRSLTLDPLQKKTILTLLQSELDFWLSTEWLEAISTNQIDELRNWLIVRDDDQRIKHMQAIRKKIATYKKTIAQLNNTIAVRMVYFDEAIDRAWEYDVEHVLQDL